MDHIQRRKLLIAAVPILAAPWFASAQERPRKIARIGLLSVFSPAATARWHQAFKQGLRDLGWVEGKSIEFDYRYAEGNADRLPGLAADLVHLNVDVIVTATATDGMSAKNATKTIPIVIAAAGDPVALGLVASLARPGGNVTGLSQMSPELAGKRLALLREIIPKLSLVAALWNPDSRTSVLNWKEIQLAARQLGIQLHSAEVRNIKDFDRAVSEASAARAGALAILPNPVIVTNLKRVADLAAKSRLPSIMHVREFPDSGGLVGLGPDRSDQFRRAAAYVDKILKGAKPGDLPIEQPTKFELVINLKTAKAIGLAIPPSVLLRADRVIE